MKEMMEIIANIQNGKVYVNAKGRGVLEYDCYTRLVYYRPSGSGYGKCADLYDLNKVLVHQFGLNPLQFVQKFKIGNDSAIFDARI